MSLSIYDYLSVAVLVAALQFLVGLWFKARLESSIKHEYDRQLEEYRAEIRRREEAARVAELFALISGGSLDKSATNKLIWEMSLWLPADMVREITRCLCSDDAKYPEEILIDIRKLFHGPKDDLKADQIAHVEIRHDHAYFTNKRPAKPTHEM